MIQPWMLMQYPIAKKQPSRRQRRDVLYSKNYAAPEEGERRKKSIHWKIKRKGERKVLILS